MFFGLITGILYCKYMYNKQGDYPDLKINHVLYPNKLEIKHGMIFYKKRHIHHWMIGLGTIPIAILFKLQELKWFCLVLTVHGLSYEDYLE